MPRTQLPFGSCTSTSHCDARRAATLNRSSPVRLTSAAHPSSTMPVLNTAGVGWVLYFPPITAPSGSWIAISQSIIAMARRSRSALPVSCSCSTKVCATYPVVSG